MNTVKTNSPNWSARRKKRIIHLAFWAGAYVLSMALATFGPEFLWDYTPSLTIAGIALNLAVGLGMILANIRHLNELDELMQRIQLEAMGLALGIGIVAGLSYSLLDVTNLISSDAEISYLVILMCVVYLSSIFINMRRYG